MRALIVLISLAMALIAGCGSTCSSYCDRMDECNALSNMNIDECTEDCEKRLDDMSSGDAADWESAADECLELESCDNFLGC